MTFEKNNGEIHNRYLDVAILVIVIVVFHLALSCMHAGTMWISIHPENRMNMNPMKFVLYNIWYPSREHVLALLIASVITAGSMYCNRHWSKYARMFGKSLSFAGVYYVMWSMARVVMWVLHPEMVKDVGHIMAIMYFYLLHPSMMQLSLTMVIIIVPMFLIYDNRN